MNRIVACLALGVSLYVSGCGSDTEAYVEESQPQLVNEDAALSDVLRNVPGSVVLATVKSGATRDAFPKLDEQVDSTGPNVIMVTDTGAHLIRMNTEALADRFRESEGPAGEASALSIQDRGWSDGVDNRTLLSTSMERHGEVAAPNGVCSGALIGTRIVRTAAHCIITNSTSGGTVPGPTSITFNYRRKGSSIPANPQSIGFFYGGAYMSSNCAKSTSTNYWKGYGDNIDACGWADWAYVILPSNWWSALGGVTAYGYRLLSSSDLSLRLRIAGYPACTTTNAPAGCVSNRQYRDETTNCTVASWISGSGTARWFSDCDTSAGMSGAGAWQWNNDGWLIGHFQWEHCYTCTSSDSAPNRFLGHDQYLFDLQNSLRATYP